MRRLFVTGTDTNVGKTLAAAILVEALSSDYWKPVQAGDLHNTDTNTVKKLCGAENSTFWPERYRLQLAASPHIAAAKEGINIVLNDFILPETTNHLVVEGAGGVLAPLSTSLSVVDLIVHLGCEAVLVSKHYLGSINHTLLTARLLKEYNIPVAGILFNGTPADGTEEIILERTGFAMLGRIKTEPFVDRDIIKKYADSIRMKL